MDFFDKLKVKGFDFNENQKNAISHVEGPLLVVAGPGSGKTSVITARTAYLIQKAAVNPSNILVITFTRAAANEMKSRFKTFPGITAEQFKKVDFGTFHSTFYKIINSYYGRNIPVLEQTRAYSFIKNILRSSNEPFDDEIVQNILNEISVFRTVKKNTEDFKSEHLSFSKFKLIVNQYECYKRSIKSIDFDDMLVMCKNILESDNNTLIHYRNKYKFFLVDEFQDTNEMQFDIIKLLCHPCNNLCVVGDDDQSIYGFRGSMPGCLTGFEEYFNSCNRVILDINYRSTKEIIEMSTRIISNNTSRIDKNLKSHRGEGEKPVIVNPPDENMEASFIAQTIESLKKQGYSYMDFAVLYRTNMQSRHVIDELIKENIPFNIKDSLNNFFDHWICRDMTCYLKLSLNNTDVSGLLQIINRPVRYIGRDSIDQAISKSLSDDISIVESFENSSLKDFQKQRIRELFSNLKTLKYMSPSSAVNYIRRLVGYDEYIRNYCIESNIGFDELYEILDEYEVSSSNFNTIPEFLSHIHEVSLKLKDTKKNTAYTRDSITLSTIHSAKGLEFPCVFVAGAVEGFYPHKKSIKTGENVEEERRLFYVAVTRARDRLFISSPKRHHGKTVSVSRFISEYMNIKDEHNALVKFSTNELVSHKTFGTGKVIQISKGVLKVHFNNKYGTRHLDIKTCIENKLIEKQHLK